MRDRLDEDRIVRHDAGGNHPVHPLRKERFAVEHASQQCARFIVAPFQLIDVSGRQLGLMNLRCELERFM